MTAVVACACAWARPGTSRAVAAIVARVATLARAGRAARANKECRFTEPPKQERTALGAGRRADRLLNDHVVPDSQALPVTSDCCAPDLLCDELAAAERVRR